METEKPITTAKAVEANELEREVFSPVVDDNCFVAVLSRTKYHQVKGFKLREPPGKPLHLILLRAMLALTVATCLVWATWLVILNITPNYTVNHAMNTGSFDNGAFWQLMEPPPVMVGLATLKFVIVLVGYSYVLIKVIKRENSSRVATQVQSVFAVRLEKNLACSVPNTSRRHRTSITALQLADSLGHYDSKARTNLKLWMKAVELIFQAISLFQILELGTPLILVVILTTTVVSNALSCAVMMFLPADNMRIAENLIDTLFSFVVAIGFPIFMLLYCFSSFVFDRSRLAINLEVFPVGWMERSAGSMDDPEQTAIIYKILRSLRMLTVLDFFTRTGVNLVLCVQMYCAADVIKNPSKQHGREYPKRHYWGAAILALFACSIVVFVEESVRTSSLACQPHPECAANAHRWIILEDNYETQCPCLILIDREIAPKTFSEWIAPKNVTEKLAQLAATGDLQVIELMNRFLLEFPEELRGCTKLNHLSLWYTNTAVIPSWFSEFTLLEFLHLETKEENPVIAMPDDMFDKMSALTYLHLGGFQTLRCLPSFHGLIHLKSLTLAALLSLKELPSFDRLKDLELLVLALVPNIDRLPDFKALTKLKAFAVYDRGAWCCNGFLGTCDLEDPKCGVHPVWHTPAAKCLTSDNVASAATQAAVAKFSMSVCGNIQDLGMIEILPSPEAMAFCNGTKYKQCRGRDSMCYNTRFMGISCTATPFPAEMRRRQIALGVGDKCDSDVEAWLGCK